MNISVVGTGYVGLVAGACFAETGHDVRCVDRDTAKVAALCDGRIPIYEPGLEELVHRNYADGRLTFTTDLAAAVRESEIIFIAVGTPQDEDGSADLQHVLGVARAVGQAMDGYRVIVNKSTVPVGTAARVRAAIAGETRHPFSVVSNPEFLKQGAAIDDFMRPDRVVIGTSDSRAVNVMLELYAPFTRTGAPIMVMDCASAELAKYAANAMLATRISFMNEVANLCEAVGADVDHVRKAIGADRRIGASFLFPGVGYGGSCFPKDVKAMLRFAADRGHALPLIAAVDRVNAAQKLRLFDKMAACFGGVSGLAGKRVAIWGLAFKPRTDDMREAPAIALIEALLEAGADVHAYDPEAHAVAQRLFGGRIRLALSSYDALTDADCLAIVTDWNEFRRPDLERLRRTMRTPIVFDGRNLFHAREMSRVGITYFSIGRAEEPAAAAITPAAS
jgi:UDPglucose 6-dehydrogenase